MNPPFTYYAFISYSRKDEGFAQKLQHYLEHYKLPSVLCRKLPGAPACLHPIFRDKTDLPIDDLDDALKEALRASQHLIVLCSPQAARPNAEGHNWVDVEVTHFDAVRQRESQHVIPLILPGAAPEDSLPESLCSLHAEQIDMNKLGEERSFNDVIARMTGIAPDALWQEYQRRKQRQKRIRRLMGVAAALLATTTAAWCWDYYVPHVRYYTDYIERDNIPEGLGELTAQEAQARTSHYRFTTRMRLLRKVEHCDARGRLTEHTDWWNRERPACMKLEYATTPQGEVEMQKRLHSNSRGEDDATLLFTQGNIDFSRHEQEAEGAQAPALPRRSVGRFEVKRAHEAPNKGIIVQELHHRYHSVAHVRDAWGTSGRAYELDAQGRTVCVRYLAVQDTSADPIQTLPATTPAGVMSYRIRYGEDGQVAEVTCFGDGQPVANEEGWARALLSYGAQGERLSVQCYDAQGKLLNL